MLYVIVLYLINATTGELEHTLVSDEPLTLEQCNKVLIERGPVPVVDGLAQFAVCQKQNVEPV